MTTTRGRIQSIDMARGIAVILVVVMHATLAVQATPAMTTLNSVLGGVRMPLLMLISGFLIAPALQTGRSLAPRIATLGWLFACWSLVTWAALAVVYRQPPNVELFLWEFVAPTTALWFVWALGLMTIAASLTPASKRPLLVISAFVASMSSHAHLIHFDLFTLDHAVENGVFFFAGATYPVLLQRLMRCSPLRCLAVTLPLLGIVRLADSEAVAQIGWQLLAFPERLLACVAALQVCALLSNIRAVAGTLTWFGRNTLPVFLAHPIMIVIVASLFGLSQIDPWAASAIIAVAALVGSIAVRWVLMSVQARWLYELPSSVCRIMEGRRQQPIPNLDPMFVGAPVDSQLRRDMVRDRGQERLAA